MSNLKCADISKKYEDKLVVDNVTRDADDETGSIFSNNFNDILTVPRTGVYIRHAYLRLLIALEYTSSTGIVTGA